MAGSRTKKVTENELERSRLSAVIHGVSFQTEAKDLERILIRQIGAPVPDMHFGDPYEIDHGEKRRKVYLNFKNKERLNQLMKIGSIKHHGEELKISRYIPKSYPNFRYITHSLLVTIYKTEQNNEYTGELTEFDLKEYFERFGEIIGCNWKSKNEIMLQFRNYDSVDQIVLYDVSHTISGIKVHVEKALTKEENVNSADNSRPSCIHVINIPVDITSEELSLIFSVHVADILLRPGYQLSSHLATKDLSMSEAWIKHLSNQQAVQDLAKKHSNIEIRGFKIQCHVVQEPLNILELCRHFEKGQCEFSANSCNYKHIMCSEPDVCDDKKCWYGHSKKREITSDRRPAEDPAKSSYRVRISNLSSTITKEQLLKRLNIDKKYLNYLRFSDKIVSNEPMVAYIVNQPSENFIRSKIQEWHNSPFSPDIPNKMKCQLEWNMDFFDWNDHSDLVEVLARNQASSSMSNAGNNTWPTATKYAPWYDGKKDTPSQNEQSNGNHTPNTARKRAMKVHDQEPSDMIQLAPRWLWTGEKLSNDRTNTGDVYSLVDKTNREVNAVIKIYKNALNQRASQCAQRERIILQKLKELDRISKFIASNINDQTCVDDPWIIMEHIEGVTLREFIRTTNPVSFRHKLIITLNLLNIVKQIHSRNIVHRHINPDNIMIRTPLVDAENNHHLLYNDKINLTLIGYSRACVTQDDELNNRMIFEDDRNHLWNTFYQTPQLEGQMSTDDLIRSPTIDTSCVCAVLFWMITKDDPKESRNIHREAPHQRKEYIKLIHDELKRATGIWTDTDKHGPLEQHLTLIFNRGFAPPDQQWPIEELAYQLQHMLHLATKNNEVNSVFPSTVSKKQMEQSSDTSQFNLFLRLASLIDWMKRQFQIHYPDVHWSNNDKNQWFGHSQQVKNRDILKFQKQQTSIIIEMICCAEINKNQELSITITAKENGATSNVLPLGVWKRYEQENDKEEILKTFELELKILIDILYRNKDYVIS